MERFGDGEVKGGRASLQLRPRPHEDDCKRKR